MDWLPPQLIGYFVVSLVSYGLGYLAGRKDRGE